MQTSYSKTVAFFVCFTISISCFYFIYFFFFKERGREGRRQLAFKTVEHQSGQHQACPICGHVGQPTLTLHSPAVRATNFEDQLSPSQLLMVGRSRNQLCVYSMAHLGLLPRVSPSLPPWASSHTCVEENWPRRKERILAGPLLSFLDTELEVRQYSFSQFCSGLVTGNRSLAN